jgi:hypothetical protein
MERYVKKRAISPKKIRSQFIKALGFARKQTQKLFPELIPDYERVEVVEVKDQSWSMYCRYLGNYTSRIEININKIHYWTHLLETVCHEAYPGHHMERLVKEKLLYLDKGNFECSILLIYTPEIVISEGMGILAETVLFERIESSKILLEHFFPNPNKEDSLQDLIAQSEIGEGFRRFESNLAYHKYVDRWSDDKLTTYAKSFKVIPDVGIKQMLEFISDELWAPYILAYQGERLITEKFGKRPTPNHFLRLISEQTLPSDLL